MSIFSGGQNDFFGLDIGTTALRVVQLKTTKDKKELIHYGQLAMVNADEPKTPEAVKQLGQAINKLLASSDITSKTVAVNLPSSKVFTTVVDMERLNPDELAKSITYQAESFIPTPIASSKIDWVVAGDSPKDAKKIEVLLSSVENSYAEARLKAVEAAGLDVIAFEPDSLALARALLSNELNVPQMVLDIGYLSTDLVICLNGVPRLARAIQIGSESIVRAAIQNLKIQPDQAHQYVYQYGLNRDNLDGKLYNAIIGTVDSLVAEIDKSIKFFASRYNGAALGRIVLTGGASSLPLFPVYVANKFNINVEIGNSWRHVSYPASKQNELLSVSNHFAVAAGLAEREL